MELKGKVYEVLPVESGEGRNGTWKKQRVVLEMESGKYPKKVMIIFWGDLVNHESFVQGNDIAVEIDIESREFNGKWYTDVKGWRINKNTESNVSTPTPKGDKSYSAPAYTDADIPPAAPIDDDLPF